jgi:hypothetical protein
VAEESVAEAAPVVGGSADSLVAGIEGAGAGEAAEAAEGEIIATMAGENFFAFSKKAFNSEQLRPWEEPILSQSNSVPCAYENAMAPLGTSLQRKAFHLKDGVFSSVEGSGEFPHIIAWNFRLLLGP